MALSPSTTESADSAAATELSGEAVLIAAALAGDGLAFRRLVEPHLGMLLRIAMRASGNRELAEDAVQETLALAHDRLAKYRPDASFKAYLCVIAARRAHTMARSERRRNRREFVADEPAALPDPEQSLRGARAARRVREALQQMPKKRREAALLRLDGAMSYREIAEAVGSSEGSARVLVHKALKELKEKLADVLGLDEVCGEGERR
jgi:RNA polymerase sigma-70 factor (ECF subfamily)